MISFFGSMVEVMENEEEECDTDLERQNVEELYDHVRHLHQTEAVEQSFNVQHPGLIPVLRPYQSQAVSWMLRREKYKSSTTQGPDVFFKGLSSSSLLYVGALEEFSANLQCLYSLHRAKVAFSLEGNGHDLWQKTLLQSLHRMVRVFSTWSKIY